MFSQTNVLYPKRALNNAGTPVASQSLAVSTVAVAATGYTDAALGGSGVNYVTFDVGAQPIRVRWDGTDPTSTVGHYLPSYSAYTWTISQYNAAKFIRDTAATGDSTVFASPMNY
jgi:hypothetical protein